ncbi:MAG: hypothetical protein NVS2B3_06150 [Vulcanimicrobiaceae bacterium]
MLGRMIAAHSSLSAAFDSLRDKYGTALTLRRDGAAVRYEMGGLGAILEPAGDAVRVTFVERAARDGVSLCDVVPLYRSVERYGISLEGARRLVADMLAFFAGTREPRFRFAGIAEGPYVRA